MPFAILRQGAPEQMTVEVVRRCRINSRVILPSGESVTVASNLLSPNLGPDVPGPDVPAKVPPADRVVPLTPLRRLYRELRSVNGDRYQKFCEIQRRLEGRHGPQGASFLMHLFKRSLEQMRSYNNSKEHFYAVEARPVRCDATHFANQLVELLGLNGANALALDDITPFEYLDYEISPLRTTTSCWENGRAATNSGAGGMDLLLVTKTIPPQPVVAEIKACTETVGATFALIQTLTYAAELLTKSQMQRLQRYFPEQLNALNTEAPQLGLLVILEGPMTEPEHLIDLRYAIALSGDLLQYPEIARSISKIEFAEGHLDGENARLTRLSGDLP